MNPTFIMMVGLPYSGKSYYAEKLSKEYGAVVHSSDAIGELKFWEMFKTRIIMERCLRFCIVAFTMI